MTRRLAIYAASVLLIFVVLRIICIGFAPSNTAESMIDQLDRAVSSQITEPEPGILPALIMWILYPVVVISLGFGMFLNEIRSVNAYLKKRRS